MHATMALLAPQVPSLAKIVQDQRHLVKEMHARTTEAGRLYFGGKGGGDSFRSYQLKRRFLYCSVYTCATLRGLFINSVQIGSKSDTPGCSDTPGYGKGRKSAAKLGTWFPSLHHGEIIYPS